MQFVLGIQSSDEVGVLFPIFQIILPRFRKENRLATIINSVTGPGLELWSVLI